MKNHPSPQPDFIRLPRYGERCAVTGMCRHSLAVLCRTGAVESKSVKTRPDAKRGVRLISRASLIAFIAKQKA